MRVVVIGPGEIGSEVIQTLLHAGHDVVVGWHRSEDAAAALPVKRYQVDVTDPESCRRLFSEVSREGGPFTGLVNCFGTIEEAALLKTDPSSADRQFQLNAIGVVNACRAAAFRLMKAGGGAIVNIGSAASEIGMPGMAIYSATKGALVSFGRSLAAELAPYRITCNTVLPGFIDCGLTAAYPSVLTDKIAEHIPLGRLGSPSDVAGVVAMLLSPAGSYITGQKFIIDGGWTLGNASMARDLVKVSCD